MIFPYNEKRTRLLLVNYTDQTDNPEFVGVYSPDGTINVTILIDESKYTGVYAKNGSVNVVDGPDMGVYSPCGALNTEI